MANTTLTQFPAGQTQYKINFDYLARPFVVVTLVNSNDPTQNRVLTVGNDYGFLNPTTIEIYTSQAGFDILQIRRFTSTESLVEFRDGSVLTAADLTNAELQAIHIAEEGRDQTVELTREFADAAEVSSQEAQAAADGAQAAADDVQDALDNLRSSLGGYRPLKSFELGNTLSEWNDILLYEADGEYYRWDGPLPKVVPAGSTPSTTGGIGAGMWLSVGDSSLRGQLAGTAGGPLVNSAQVKAAGIPQGSYAQARPHITPEMYGAKGDGVTDDTVAIRAAFQAGSDLRLPVWGSGKTYAVTSTLWMQANQPEVGYMNIDVTRPDAAGEVSELFSYKTAGTERITVEFHHVRVATNKKVRQVLILDGTRRCKIHNCTFLDVDTPECYGIRIGISNNGFDNLYNEIYNNYLTIGDDPDVGVGPVTRNGIVAFSNYEEPTVGQAGGPNWSGFPPSVQFTKIYNNTVIGGTHNIHLRGCNIVEIYNNTLIGGSHRNINLSRMCQRVHIHDNMLINAGSSAVVFGYCRWIKITDNYIYSSQVSVRGGDDSAIQFGEWVEELHIQGNTVLGDWKWGIHGETLRGGMIIDNSLEASRAAIALETQWVSTVPDGALYSVPRTVPFRANTNTFDVKISGNKWKGQSGACFVYLSAFNGRQMQRVDVSDNFLSNASMGHAFCLYEDTAGLIGNVRLHEMHAPGAQFSNYLSNSTSAISSVIGVSGLNSALISHAGSFQGNGAKTLTLSDAHAVTNITSGYQDGDTISIRGADSGGTLVHDTARIRLRGATTATFPDANSVISLVRQSGIWFETARNF